MQPRLSVSVFQRELGVKLRQHHPCESRMTLSPLLYACGCDRHCDSGDLADRKDAVSSRPALIPGRAMLLILMALTLGPGLLANAGFKENWNRPRPGVVQEFGGPMTFKAWWDTSGECPRNCSFVSGESAAAFAMLAPAALVGGPLRLIAIAAATLFGALIAFLRVMFGGHFFTDVVFAAALSAFVVWTLHGWLYRWQPLLWSDRRIEDALGDAGRHGREALIALGRRLAAIANAIIGGVGARFGRALGAAHRRG
jgi:membrane-associated phospholipid phosphatase